MAEGLELGSAGRALAAVLAAALGCAAQDAGERAPSGAAPAAPRAALERAVAQAIERGDVPGAVALVGRGETVACVVGGARALLPEREELGADTLFDLASLTKPVATATAIVQLADRGRLDLGSPVARYLPGFGVAGKERVTVEDLLLHRSGLVADNPLADFADGPAAAWERILALSLEGPPGAAFVYSDVGYIVLGELVRAVDGRALDAYAREEIFAPLGMAATTFRPGAAARARCAPTERDGEHFLRGIVHDPRARALGGVAGHAGLFSTAADLARWCRMILGGGELDGVRVLSRAAVEGMTRPRWLGDGSGGRSLGFDVDTRFSAAPRGTRFPRGASFGHTGFTGTSLWLDPDSGGYVIVLASRLHPAGAGSAAELRRAVADAAAAWLRPAAERGGVLTGADVLAREGCARLRGLRLGLLTHDAGRTRSGVRTVDLLAEADGVVLERLFTPEHGLASQGEGAIADGRDARTGIEVVSLYGDRRAPEPAQLARLDALVVDLAHVGVRFYTYGTTLGYAMEACAAAGVKVIVLDRPDPLSPYGPAGPCADESALSFIAYRPLPVLPGLTLGELARLYRSAYGVDCELEVVPVEGWRRAMTWPETGLPWRAPSPNLRNPEAAVLYGALGLLEGANLSVGRGTDEPFERLGAPWIDGVALAEVLRARPIAGLACTPIEFVPDEGPFAGERCGGVHVALSDARAFRPVEAGLALGWQLERLFGEAFDASRVDARLASHATWERWLATSDPTELSDLEAGWQDELRAFEALRAGASLYE